MVKKTPYDVYDMLVNGDKILSATGKISFDFGDVNIVVHQKDVVGNIIQEWLQGWLEKKGIIYAPSDNPQMPPDFYLDPSNKKTNLLEVKAFNYDASAAFDIADFRMYIDELVSKPWMLDVWYLIFGYDMSSTGVVTIKKLWIKKVWQITAASEKWPLKLQVKKDVVHKIRPCNWDSISAKYPVFASKEDFLSAVEETVFRNPATHGKGGTWRSDFISSYKKFTGTDINIPRWMDISHKYQK